MPQNSPAAFTGWGAKCAQWGVAKCTEGQQGLALEIGSNLGSQPGKGSQ